MGMGSEPTSNTKLTRTRKGYMNYETWIRIGVNLDWCEFIRLRLQPQ
jgi:hypothetical protein